MRASGYEGFTVGKCVRLDTIDRGEIFVRDHYIHTRGLYIMTDENDIENGIYKVVDIGSGLVFSFTGDCMVYKVEGNVTILSEKEM